MPTLEERVRILEEKVDCLERVRQDEPVVPWWDRHFGAFKDDPMFEEAVRLGEEYRKAQPNPADSPDALIF